MNCNHLQPIIQSSVTLGEACQFTVHVLHCIWKGFWSGPQKDVAFSMFWHVWACFLFGMACFCLGIDSFCRYHRTFLRDIKCICCRLTRILGQNGFSFVLDLLP